MIINYKVTKDEKKKLIDKSGQVDIPILQTICRLKLQMERCRSHGLIRLAVKL